MRVGSKTFRFFNSWKPVYTWLSYDADNDLLFCYVYKNQSKTSSAYSAYVTGSKATRFNSLEKHSLSNPRINSQAAVRAVENPQSTPMALALGKLKGESLGQMRCLFNTAYFVAQEDLAFTKFEKLCALQSLNGVKMGKQYINDKRPREFVGFIAEAMRHGQSDELSKINYISVMSDSSTDRFVTENEIVYIRYINQKGLPQSLFAGLGAVRKADSKGILEAIDHILPSRGWLGWKDKMVGFGADGASVMMGHKGGVAALLKVDIPHLVEIHCVAHRLQLSVLDAIRDHSYISEFESGLKKLFSFYNKSPKRLGELREVASLLKEIVRVFGSLHQVRWMASKQRALNVTINNWKSVVSHLQDTFVRVTKNESTTAENLLIIITSCKWVSCLHFFADLMDTLTKLSLQMQSDVLIGIKLVVELDTTKMELYNLNLRPGKHL